MSMFFITMIIIILINLGFLNLFIELVFFIIIIFCVLTFFLCIYRAYDSTSSQCHEKLVSGSWHNEHACISKVEAQMNDNPAYKDAKSIKFVCTNNAGFPDVWGFSDDNCEEKVVFHPAGG